MTARRDNASAEALRDLALIVGAAAADHAVTERRRGLAFATKSSMTDLVTNVDRSTEELIVSLLLDARPNDGVLGEEGGERSGTSGVRWILDPIDGTTNFVYDLPGWAVSIGAEVDGEVVAGAVICPSLASTYAAARGLGATCNGVPLHLAVDCPPLAQALVGTGFSYLAATRRQQAERLVTVVPEVRDIRRAGAAAMDLCAVASGRLDAYFEEGLGPWDLAAGGLIAVEAGAHASSLDGGQLRPGSALVCHPGLAAALIELIARADGLASDSPN